MVESCERRNGLDDEDEAGGHGVDEAEGEQREDIVIIDEHNRAIDEERGQRTMNKARWNLRTALMLYTVGSCANTVGTSG